MSRNSFLAAGIACALTISAAAQGAGRYVEVEYPPSAAPGELQVGVTYILWVPEGVTRLRGVIVHQHGAGRNAASHGATAAYDLHWQALAKKWDCALLGPTYHVLNDAIDTTPGGSQLWFDPGMGSDKTFLRALEELGSKSGHAEFSAVSPAGLPATAGSGRRLCDPDPGQRRCQRTEDGWERRTVGGLEDHFPGV